MAVLFVDGAAAAVTVTEVFFLERRRGRRQWLRHRWNG